MGEVTATFPVGLRTSLHFVYYFTLSIILYSTSRLKMHLCTFTLVIADTTAWERPCMLVSGIEIRCKSYLN